MKFEFTDCGGCTTCQLACSYKHTGAFQPDGSSIQIQCKEDYGFEVEIAEETDGKRFACDGCKNLEDGGQPMCVRYCHKREDLIAIIDQYCEAKKI